MIERFPLLSCSNIAPNSFGPKFRPVVRHASPAPGVSTLMTFAPRSASTAQAAGAAAIVDSSTTSSPASIAADRTCVGGDGGRGRALAVVGSDDAGRRRDLTTNYVFLYK